RPSASRKIRTRSRSSGADLPVAAATSLGDARPAPPSRAGAPAFLSRDRSRAGRRGRRSRSTRPGAPADPPSRAPTALPSPSRPPPQPFRRRDPCDAERATQNLLDRAEEREPGLRECGVLGQNAVAIIVAVERAGQLEREERDPVGLEVARRRLDHVGPA